VAAYVNQVLIAYGDVEDALTDLHALTSETESLQQAVVASENYRRLAQVQYTNGLVDYLIVIDAERTLLANQLALSRATSARVTPASIWSALGGGWRDPSSEITIVRASNGDINQLSVGGSAVRPASGAGSPCGQRLRQSMASPAPSR
jgi:outer membrane protein TolC